MYISEPQNRTSRATNHYDFRVYAWLSKTSCLNTEKSVASLQDRSHKLKK